MNNLGFFRVLGFTATVLVVAALALQATAAELQPPRESQELTWIWSATSATLNNSTAALASGHVGRAIRLADSAARASANTTDRTIAAHNICVGHLAQGDITGATTSCHAALLPSETTRVTWQRGAWIAADSATPEDRAEAIPLTDVIRANIAKAYGAAVIESYGDVANAALW